MPVYSTLDGQHLAQPVPKVPSSTPRTATQNATGHKCAARPNDGSARGYQELSAPLTVTATAGQAGGQAVCFSLSHKRIPTKTISTRAPAGFK